MSFNAPSCKFDEVKGILNWISEVFMLDGLSFECSCSEEACGVTVVQSLEKILWKVIFKRFMAVCLRIKDVALLLYIIGISQADRDLLDNIHLNAENPPEVNDFLHSVLQHRNDFRWIRRYAQRSEPADFRKSTYVPPVPEFFKRSVASEGLRPVNDVQPYVYENSQEDASDFRSRKFSRRRGRPQRRSKKRRGLSSQRHRRSKGSLSLDLSNSENDNGEVKIVPRSQAGVLNVPGQKYFGRHRKSAVCDEPDHNQHEVIFKNKTQCRPNDTHEGNEYYYTSPHDLLGLSQDVSQENENKNKSCTSTTKRKSSHRKVRNSTNSQAVPIMLPLGKPMSQAGPLIPLKLNSPSSLMGLAFTVPTQRSPMRMFQQPTMPVSQTPLENPYPMLTVRAPSTPSVGPIKGVMRNPGNTDFIKLVHYIDTPSKDAPFSKQELLGKDNDDLLENIDHVLKADRSGLHMYKGVNSFQSPITKKKVDSNYVDLSSSTGMPMFRTLDGHPLLQNIIGSRRILPVRIANIQKRTRSIMEKDLRNLNEEEEDENLPEVELKFNSHPISKVKAKKPTARRRINLGRKKKKKIDKQRYYASSQLTTPTTTMRIPSSGIMFTLTPNDNSVVNDPNIKLLENADDDNNKNLKLTLKEYLNRENAYNMEKQQQEDEEDENAFDYNNIQQKKVELEDLTEPTSAAEQRELGRKDEPATPSLNESGENDNQFIVIPLKKDIPMDPSLIYTKTEYDNIRSADGGFKVKEAEDVIHLGKHASGGRLGLEKSEDAPSPDKEPLKKRNLLQKPNVANVAQESPSILNLESDDYAYDNSFKDYKIKPEKQDYNYYENFEQKREVSQPDAPAFKGRKLQNLNMKGSSDDYLVPNGGDHMVSSLTKDLIKRSEDDEPDEEPGNDIKEPHYKHKKVQENEPLDLSPKIEETETLHMDVIDPKRRSFVASMDKLKLADDESIDKKASIKDESMKSKRMKFDFKKKKHHHHKHNKEKMDRAVDDERDDDDDDEDEEDDDDEDMDEANLKCPQKNAINRDAEDGDKNIARKFRKGRPIAVTITSLDDLKLNDNLRIKQAESSKDKHPNMVAVKEDYGCSSTDEESTGCGVEEEDTTSSASYDTTTTTCSDDETTTQTDSPILNVDDDSTVGASTGASFRVGSEKSYDTGGSGESTTCLLISAKPFNGDLATIFGTDDVETETTCSDTESTECSKKQDQDSDTTTQSTPKIKTNADTCDVVTSASSQNNDDNNYGSSTDNCDEKQLLCCYINKNKLKNNKQNSKHKKQGKSGDGDDQINVVLMKRGKAHTDTSSDENEKEVTNEDKEQEDVKENLDKDDSVEKIDKDDSEIDSEQEDGKLSKKLKEGEDDPFRETDKAVVVQEVADNDDKEIVKSKKLKVESDEEVEEDPDVVYNHNSKGKKFNKAKYTNKLESEKEEKYLKNHPGEEEKMKELQDYEEQAANSGMKGGVPDFTEQYSNPFKDTTDKREQVRSDEDMDDDDDSDDFDDNDAFENDNEISKAFKLRSSDFKGSKSTKFSTSSSTTTGAIRSTTSEADEDIDSDNSGRASTRSTTVVATTKSTTEDIDFDSTLEDRIAKKSTTEGAAKLVTTFSKKDHKDVGNSEESQSEDSNSSDISKTEERSSQDSSEECTDHFSTGSDTDKGLTFMNFTISVISGKSNSTSEVTPDGCADTQQEKNGPSEEDLKELTNSIVKLVKSGKFCNKHTEHIQHSTSNTDFDSTDSSDSTGMPTEGTDQTTCSESSTSETSNFSIEFASTAQECNSTTSTCSTESLTDDNAISHSSTGKNPTSESDCSNYESGHKVPDKPTFAPMKDEPVEEAEMMVEPKKGEEGKNKPILIKSSTVVQINSQPDCDASSTIDADDAIPQHIDEGDIKDIIASQYPKLPVALVPKRSHFVEELAEEEIQENDKRNMLAKSSGHLKNQEALVENLQKLINRYKTRLKGNSLQNRDIINMVHHHSEKKKQKSIPKDSCVTEPGSYYDRGTSDPVKREATSDSTDDDDDELDFYHEKRIYHNRLEPLTRPIKEAFMDAESVDDGLKEKMVFQKVYDSVVRSKKKVHNPEVYKIIDEYFDNTQQQSEDELPVCPVDDSTENIEIPVKRKQEYEELQKEKEEDEDATEDTGGGLVDVIRARKKTYEIFDRKKKKALNQKKSIPVDSITPEQPEIQEEARETTPALDQTDPELTHEPRVQLDNVDSFKDVIEHPIGMFVKRRIPGSRQLQNLNEMSDTYLSPMDEEQGYENRRLRRKLRYLRHQPRQAQAPDRVIPFNYNDYIQNHRQGRHFGQEHDGETNFHDVPNSNPSTEADTSVTPSRMKGLTIRSDSSTSTGPNCDNGTKPLSEEELKKREREDMRNMLNGDLPMHMINVFYNKLRDNAALYNRFGGSITSSKECSFENVMNIKNFREEQAKVDIKHAEEMLHEVIVMLNRIVADQVHRKTCLKLSPNLKLYIIRITKGMRNFKKNNQIAEGYPLPKIKYRSNEDIMTAPPEQDEQGQLLFEDESHTEPSNEQSALDKTAVRKRIKLIEKLLEKYQRMSMRCQVQVEPVRNYLMDHLQLLMKSLEKSEALSSTTCAPIGFHAPKEPQICEEDLEPPKSVVQLTAGEDAKAIEEAKEECPTTIKQRSIQLGNEPESEIAHRQQVLMETQLDQKKLDEVNQFMADQQREQEQASNTPEPHGYKQDSQQRDIENSQDVNAYKDYRRSEEDSPQKENRQAPPPGAFQPQPPAQPAMPAAQLQPQLPAAQPFMNTEIDKSKYTNPDLVNKDLFALGLGGINTYLPPFSVSDMVKDIKTTNRVGGMSAMPAAEPTSYGNTKVPPLPPSGPTGVPSPPKPRSEPILEKLTVTHQPLISFQKDRFARSERYKRVPGEDGEEDSNEDAASKIRQLALNPYQQPMEEIPSYSFKPSRTTLQEDPFKVPQDPLRDMVDLNKLGDMDPPKLMEYEDINMLPRPKVVPEMMDATIEQQMQQMALMQSQDMAKTPMKENQAPPMDEANNYAMPPFNSQYPHVKNNPYRDSQRNANAPKTKKANMRKVGPRKSEWNGTAKYKKLMEAYESLREKRQNEERLAKLFGSKDDDKLALKTANKQIQDISKVNFEKPLVFSLDA